MWCRAMIEIELYFVLSSSCNSDLRNAIVSWTSTFFPFDRFIHRNLSVATVIHKRDSFPSISSFNSESLVIVCSVFFTSWYNHSPTWPDMWQWKNTCDRLPVGSPGQLCLQESLVFGKMSATLASQGSRSCRSWKAKDDIPASKLLWRQLGQTTCQSTSGLLISVLHLFISFSSVTGLTTYYSSSIKYWYQCRVFIVVMLCPESFALMIVVNMSDVK